MAPYAVAAAAPALLAAKGAVAFTAGLSATGTLVAGAAGGGLAGFIATGSLKGALIGVASGVAFAQVGNMFAKGGSLANIGSKFASAGSRAAETMTAGFKVLAHGIVGGVRSVLSGARFEQGFLAAGFTEAFSPVISYAGASGGIVAEYSAAALIGGCGSQLAGGKFADGAMTGVFSRVFNEWLHKEAFNQRYGAILRAGGIDIDANIARAKEMGLGEFIDAVRTGGDWDYKGKGYMNSFTPALRDEFGNVHFGIVANAFGFDLATTLSGAGVYQSFWQGGGDKADALQGYIAFVAGPDGPISNSDAQAFTKLGFSWGDNPGDSIHIMRGYSHYYGK